MKLNIFCNVSTRKPEATSSGQSLTLPEFTAGDRVKIAVRFLEQIEGSRVERGLRIRNARLTLGVVDAPPISGQFSLKIGSGASTSANTTPLLSHTISAQALDASVTALSSINGSPKAPVSVTFDGGTYSIRFADGSAPGISVVTNTLAPTSFARIRSRETNGATEYDMRLTQAPLAQAPVFTRELPQPPTIATVQDGGTDPSGVTVWPDIQRLTLPALFRGTFILRFGLYQKSPILSADLDAERLKEALEVLFAANEYTPDVRDEGDGRFLIVFNDENSIGLDIAPMTVEVFTAPEGDVTFDLDLNTGEVFDAVRAISPRKDCVLELEADIVDDDESPSDPEAVARTVTLLQAPVVLRRELRWDGLEASATVDWLRPPEPRDYIPFTTDQILTGNLQAYSDAIGDGAATSFVVSHNLGSELCMVLVRENVAGGEVLTPDLYTVEIDSEDQVTITFPSAPALDAYVLNVVAVGADSVFQNHTHTIGQITNLQTILDDLGSRVEDLEDIIVPGVAVAPTETSAPGLVTVIPEVAEVIAWRGTEEEMAAVFTDNGVDATKLPARRAPVMLPAVHDGTLTDPMPDPLPAPAAGTVWVADARTLIPGGSGMRSSYVENDGHVASDGRMLYVATRDGVTNSYYPAAFERTLFAMAINADMLAVKRTLEILWGVQAQLVHATCQAQWVMSLQVGTFSAEVEPATLGLNLEAVTWAAPVFSQAIVLSRLAQSHFFGVRISRSASEILLDQQKYGNWTPNNDAAPASANFAIRARLDRFDTENRSDPRGYVAWKLVGSIETDEEGKQKTKPAQARIY